MLLVRYIGRPGPTHRPPGTACGRRNSGCPLGTKCCTLANRPSVGPASFKAFPEASCFEMGRPPTLACSKMWPTSGGAHAGRLPEPNERPSHGHCQAALSALLCTFDHQGHHRTAIHCCHQKSDQRPASARLPQRHRTVRRAFIRACASPHACSIATAVRRPQTAPTQHSQPSYACRPATSRRPAFSTWRLQRRRRHVHGRRAPPQAALRRACCMASHLVLPSGPLAAPPPPRRRQYRRTQPSGCAHLQGCCALCSATKSPSFRKNIITGKLICEQPTAPLVTVACRCPRARLPPPAKGFPRLAPAPQHLRWLLFLPPAGNACCCFLYRTVRGSQQDGAHLSQAVTDLALRLLAGKGTLPSMTVRLCRGHRQGLGGWGGAAGEGREGVGSVTGGMSIHPRDRYPGHALVTELSYQALRRTRVSTLYQSGTPPPVCPVCPPTCRRTCAPSATRGQLPGWAAAPCRSPWSPAPAAGQRSRWCAPALPPTLAWPPRALPCQNASPADACRAALRRR